MSSDMMLEIPPKETVSMLYIASNYSQGPENMVELSHVNEGGKCMLVDVAVQSHGQKLCILYNGHDEGGIVETEETWAIAAAGFSCSAENVLVLQQNV